MTRDDHKDATDNPVFADPDGRLPRAERYAQAISIAAAANQRVLALEGALARSEWHREQAELQLMSARGGMSDSVGQVLTAADPQPDSPYTEWLIDMRDGSVWSRNDDPRQADDGSEHWVRRDGRRYRNFSGWPIEDAGPFMAIPDCWGLRDLVHDLEKLGEQEERLHNLLMRREGYKPTEAGPTWQRHPLPEALPRVLAALEGKADSARAALVERDARVTQLAAELQQLRDNGGLTDDERKLGLNKQAIRKTAGAIARAAQEGLASEEDTVHSLVRRVEAMMYEAAEVPEEGDPVYDPDRLAMAAAVLLSAMAKNKPAEEPDEEVVVTEGDNQR